MHFQNGRHMTLRSVTCFGAQLYVYISKGNECCVFGGAELNENTLDFRTLLRLVLFVIVVSEVATM